MLKGKRKIEPTLLDDEEDGAGHDLHGDDLPGMDDDAGDEIEVVDAVGEPPEERDAVFDWLVEHKVVAQNAKKKAGAFICKAPGDVVGPYACGDVERTWRLFRLLAPSSWKKNPHTPTRR